MNQYVIYRDGQPVSVVAAKRVVGAIKAAKAAGLDGDLEALRGRDVRWKDILAAMDADDARNGRSPRGCVSQP